MRLDELGRQPADVLVIGGGILGLFTAYDAAARGLSVTLVERSDFGGELTLHQRTVEGGLSPFTKGKLGRSVEQIRERRAWARMAPHLLRPLPFLAGTYRWTARSRALVKMGSRAYDFVGRRRNWHVSPELHIPRMRLESAAATRRLFPGIRDAGLTGGCIWYDYQTRYPYRLTWTVAMAALAAGAKLFNYVEAIDLARDAGRIVGARVRDARTGEERDIRASVTILASGAGTTPLLSTIGVASGAESWLRAMNVLLNRPARDIALVAPLRPSQTLTAVPWSGHLMVGTHYSKRPIDSGAVKPPDEAVEAFLHDVNTAFPHLAATPRDIRALYSRVVPADVHGSETAPIGRPRVRRHAANGHAGLVSVLNARYADARAAAERAVDAAFRELGQHGRRSRTGETELPHAGIADSEGRLIEALRDLQVTLDRDVLEHLISWYGTEAPAVVTFSADQGLLDRLPGAPVLAGEVAYAMDYALAMALTDVVLRRTPLGAAGPPARDAVTRVSAIMAARGQWNAERTDAEIAALDAFYAM